MPPAPKHQRNYELLEMLIAGHLPAEVAFKFGVSHQRVRQIARAYKLDLKQIKAEKENKLAEKIAPYLKTMYDTVIAKEFNISADHVRRIRKELGFKRVYLPIGCHRCKTHPYAKGMCRNCHSRWRRRKNRAGKVQISPS